MIVWPLQIVETELIMHLGNQLHKDQQQMIRNQ